MLQNKIWMCPRERKIQPLKPPQILNCNENLDSLESQAILNYYLNSFWDSASSWGKKKPQSGNRKLGQEIDLMFLKSSQKAK